MTDVAQLTIDGVSHRYGSTQALNDVSLRIETGEFVTLLGPSGCGKTTLLRIIGGFERPTSGRVLLAEQDVTRVPPHKRPVNMVFQRVTLFPHLNVAENISFGLRIARVPKTECQQRVDEVLELVRLPGFQDRRAHELSGGQMQRIALARALVNRPSVLLFDEPLSALDLKIRLEMEAELRRLHREIGITCVFVTHDQREALALSDRIAVLSDGRLQQVGPPGEVHGAPKSAFVARFVGDANVLPVEATRAVNGTARIALGDRQLSASCPADLATGPAWLVVRPEIVLLRAAESETEASITGIVRDQAFRGTGFTYGIEVEGVAGLFKAEVPARADMAFEVGSTVTIEWDPTESGLLPRDD